MKKTENDLLPRKSEQFKGDSSNLLQHPPKTAFISYPREGFRF